MYTHVHVCLQVLCPSTAVNMNGNLNLPFALSLSFNFEANPEPHWYHMLSHMYTYTEDIYLLT